MYHYTFDWFSGFILILRDDFFFNWNLSLNLQSFNELTFKRDAVVPVNDIVKTFIALPIIATASEKRVVFSLYRLK